MKNIFGLLTLVLTLISLTGCGLKGPLYFPPEKSSTSPADQKNVTKEQSIQTMPSRNNRGVGDEPTQVVY